MQVFTYLVQVPTDIIESPRHDLVTTTACNLIANGISALDMNFDDTSVPHWRKIVNIGLKSKNMSVQEAAAGAMAAVSELVDCSAVVDRCFNQSISRLDADSFFFEIGLSESSAMDHLLCNRACAGCSVSSTMRPTHTVSSMSSAVC